MKKSLFTALMPLLICTQIHALDFVGYQNDQGQKVFTNVPRNCVKDGRLVCHRYYFLAATESKAGDESGAPKNRQITENQRPSKPEASSKKPVNGIVKVLADLQKARKISDEIYNSHQASGTGR